MRRSLPLLVILPLLFACSGDRNAPKPAPPAVGTMETPTGPQSGGSTVAGEGTNATRAATRNASPEIRGIQFVGGDGRPGNTLGVVAEGTDADGDPVKLEIAWRKNDQPSGTGNLLATAVKRGDKVSVTVTPFDGKGRGKSATLSREILNTPPAIEGQEQFQVTDNAVTFHVRASDADGDPMTYSIKDAPPGMSIDRGTGWVRWVTSPGTTGKAPLTVVVSDGSGGESTARITVTIAEQPSNGAR